MIFWMCALLSGTAHASESVDDPLPLQVHDEGRWTSVDQRADRMARMAGPLTLTSAVVTGAGALMVLGGNADGALTGLGTLGVATGTIGLVVGPPVVLAGSLRSARSLRSRGVMLTRLPGALGWTCYGLILLSPAAQRGALVLAPALYVGSVALGYVQIGINARHRADARLTPVAARRSPVRVGLAPTPHGVRLTGIF